MFSRQKAQTDVKKSTVKFLDGKKDVQTRLKHLKLILESVDISEAKALFATNYSHIYHLVYEGIVCAESSLKVKGGFLSPSSLSFTLSENLPFYLVHRAQREELESVLQLLERIIMLLPDLLHCRWQLHSISRLMAKLNHPANSMALRKQAIRLFIMYYQCLGTAGPAYVHTMFASLVPGLPGAESWPPPSDPSFEASPYEITPVLPASSGDRQLLPEDPTSYFLELLLDCMVSQAPKIHWNDGSQMWSRSIEFLYEKFKELYLPRIFSDFNVTTDIYKPSLDLPEPRKSADLSNNVITACQVVFVKWIANYAHSVYRSMESSIPGQMASWSSQNAHSHHDDPKISTPPSSLGDRDSIASYSSINNDVDANVIAKDVILGSRSNINFLHEVFRRALLMNFVHTVAIRRVICVYKDWIQMNVPELPVFMLEPEEGDSEAVVAGNLDSPKNRLRTDSYYGAVGINANNNREEYLSHLRSGAQKVLQVFFCNSASVFLLFQIPKHEAAMAFLEEQVDICKRVLNIYRYAVMNTRMNCDTWEQLLVVLLHVTSKVLDTKQSHFGVKNPDSLGSKLASALFQTLIVSWVKASLNVPLSTELWNRLHQVLSQLTFCDDLVTEWSKTMETLTRVLSRHVYNLDLANLPLDRVSDRRNKKKHGALANNQPIVSVTSEHEAKRIISDAPDGKRDRYPSTGTGSDRKSLVYSATATTTPTTKRKLKRSLSDGNLATPRKVENETSTDGDFHSHSLVISSNREHETPENYISSSPEVTRQRKKSHSMDSLRTLKIASHFGHIGQPGCLNSDWAEISSSTTSLENASTIHIDDSGSIDCHGGQAKHEVKGVISGGTVKGWLPSVAAILWRRMLGILGNVNEFTSPKTHAHFFQVLTEIWGTLYKLRLNQGVSLDNLSTPPPSELCPPLTCFSSWCLQALDLTDDYYRGKVLACALLCDATIANQDIPLSQEYLTKFYSAIHKTIIANQPEMVNEIVKRCGYKLVSKMLPGYSLLLLDLSQAAHSILTSDDLKKAPRVAAASVLGSVLTVADVCKELPILKPNSKQFQPVTSHATNNVVLSCLLQFSKSEQTSQARAICLQSLTIYLCKELTNIRYIGFRQSEKDRISTVNTIISVLLASVKVANRSVALVASDLLLLLSDFASEICVNFLPMIEQIIQGLKWSLQQALPLKNSSWKTGKPVETEKRLLISLITTIGEWCMKLPLNVLLTPLEHNKPILISSVFEVLHMAAKGFQIPSTCDGSLHILEDFDPSIPFDDLQITSGSVSNLKAGGDKESFLTKSDGLHSPSQDLETVKLAARTVISHLLTQLGHFPMANGSSKCGSVVSENDDLPGLNSELDELSTYIFSLPNVQMFALNENTLLSIVELPEDLSSSGTRVSSGFVTSLSQVRIIMRDLSGKGTWDAAQLYSPNPHDDHQQHDPSLVSRTTPNQSEELFYLSTITGNFLPQLGPRLTVRRRGVGVLPTVANSADDLDNLDDLLSYIGHTSEEVLQKVGEPLNVPWKPPSAITQENEDDVVAAVVNQRNAELEFLMKFDMDLTMKARPVSYSQPETDFNSEQGDLPSLTRSVTNIGSSFMLSRRFFSQLGLMGWDKRDTIDVLNKDERLLRELKHLDSQKCRETHKIAVIYVAEGQEDKQSILSNTGGSEVYEDFVAGLGWEIDLETHTGFMGGLQRNKSTGLTAPYFATSFTEVIFHVATRMPSTTEDCLLQKTRHLGNDEIHIVWSEHSRDYRRDIIPTEFCDVLIVIYPLKFGLFRIQISRKAEVPYFGPLYNEAVVERDVLALLVRATAINASRAKQSSLELFEHHFEVRAKALAKIIKNHKCRSTFEQFASSVFCPVLPPPTFSSGVSNRASVASFSASSRVSGNSATTLTANSSSSSNQLSTALLDSTIPISSRRTYDIPFTPPGRRRILQKRMQKYKTLESKTTYKTNYKHLCLF
ncbi:ral GTPase-activating protein subunit alpha-1 isoform X3 [Folsomia candida]|uniref:ral GTPase-activating protein subunit alpha-1 isoform X3 n=1 Tax=Folsomia candida TaxID=158441 RepID=UPI001604AB6D|nr:ral GTPase-activating protein subunit alpha-1 isoform X3 [Folsomia candida]